MPRARDKEEIGHWGAANCTEKCRLYTGAKLKATEWTRMRRCSRFSCPGFPLRFCEYEVKQVMHNNRLIQHMKITVALFFGCFDLSRLHLWRIPVLARVTRYPRFNKENQSFCVTQSEINSSAKMYFNKVNWTKVSNQLDSYFENGKNFISHLFLTFNFEDKKDSWNC